MRGVGCKRTDAVRRNNKGQLADWIGTRTRSSILPFVGESLSHLFPSKLLCHTSSSRPHSGHEIVV